MFDLGRALILLWSGAVLVRQRAWLGVAPLVFAAYVLALGVAGGIAVRHEGPQEVMTALMLVIMGPSAIPRGHLPGLPLGSFVVGWPLVSSALSAAGLVLSGWRFDVHAESLPQAFDDGGRINSIVLALWLAAGSECLCAGMRIVLYAFDWTTQ